MRRVSILGAGVMGTAMVLPFADRGFKVDLVGTFLDEAIVTSVQQKNFHPRLNVTLPVGVKAWRHEAFSQTLDADTDLVMLGVASAGIPWAIEQLTGAMTRPIPVLMITKGMAPEERTLTALPDVVQKALTEKFGVAVPVAAIAGPCIAGELAVRRHTGTVIVSRDLAYATHLCGLLETDYYHPRPSTDMIGAEVCAAFKNFFAIGVGWAHGILEQMEPAENAARNNNAAAVIFDQAIREMMILVQGLGGESASVWGMPGAGDLYVTCMAGRNSRLGNNLGRGLTYGEVKSGPMKDDTIEGAELGIAVASSLAAMMAAGVVDGKSLPLTRSLLKALREDCALTIPWKDFHRSP